MPRGSGTGQRQTQPGQCSGDGGRLGVVSAVEVDEEGEDSVVAVRQSLRNQTRAVQQHWRVRVVLLVGLGSLGRDGH